MKNKEKVQNEIKLYILLITSIIVIFSLYFITFNDMKEKRVNHKEMNERKLLIFDTFSKKSKQNQHLYSKYIDCYKRIEYRLDLEYQGDFVYYNSDCYNTALNSVKEKFGEENSKQVDISFNQLFKNKIPI